MSDSSDSEENNAIHLFNWAALCEVFGVKLDKEKMKFNYKDTEYYLNFEVVNKSIFSKNKNDLNSTWQTEQNSLVIGDRTNLNINYDLDK